jgi:hypothetical protein
MVSSDNAVQEDYAAEVARPTVEKEFNNIEPSHKESDFDDEISDDDLLEEDSDLDMFDRGDKEANVIANVERHWKERAIWKEEIEQTRISLQHISIGNNDLVDYCVNYQFNFKQRCHCT